MNPSQPYQRGMPTWQPGGALAAMMAGRTLYGGNPMDVYRQGALAGPEGALSKLLASLPHLQQR